MQSDQYIPAEDIYGEMTQLEQLLDNLEQRGVELEKKLRDSPNGNLQSVELSESVNSRKMGKREGSKYKLYIEFIEKSSSSHW